MIKIILLLLIIILLLSYVIASFKAAPWVPTKKMDVNRFLKLSKIEKGQRVFDLGCGDGRLLLAAAKQGAKTTGYEISLIPYIICKLRMFLNGIKGKIYLKDFWKANLKNADLIYIFLMPKANKKIKQKFEEELNKGTKVVSYVWPIPGWVPIKVDKLSQSLPIYLYKV